MAGPDARHRPLPRPAVGRTDLHAASAAALAPQPSPGSVPFPAGLGPLSRRHGRSGASAALRRHAATLVVGAIVVAALALVVVLVVSVGRASSGPAGAGADQAVSGLTIPAGYVPPTSDARDAVAQPGAAQTQPGTQAPTRVAVPSGRTRAVAGGWTPTIGAQIANRALRWLNTPYSWDAGDADGPTLGRAVDFDSRHDASVRGFDCSGLVIYALAPWLHVDHSAAAQYVQAGTVHPTFAQLQPGDLVFWSSDGSVKGVGHVAIYIGNGDVVQAPQSGELVKITPIGQVEAGTIGTTRPLTA